MYTKKVLYLFSQPITWEDEPEIKEVETDLWADYDEYQHQVQNRVAESIDCDPSDLNDEIVVLCFIEKLSIREAAIRAEHDLMEGTFQEIDYDQDDIETPF